MKKKKKKESKICIHYNDAMGGCRKDLNKGRCIRIWTNRECPQQIIKKEK